MFKKVRNQKGFTLIELIVVIAILAILAAIAIPRLSGFSEQAKQAADKEAAAVVANAAAMYHANNPTDATITIAELTAANLITANDLRLQSELYTTATKTSIEDGDIALNGDVVTVTLTADAGGTNYQITK